MDFLAHLGETVHLFPIQQALLLLASLTALLAIRRTDSLRLARIGIPLLAFLFLRDLVYFFLPFSAVALAGDAVAGLFLVFLLYLDFKELPSLLALIGLSLVYLASLILTVLAILPDYIGVSAALVVPLGGLVFFIVKEHRSLDRHNSPSGFSALAIFYFLPLSYTLFSSFFPAINPIYRQFIVLPLAYFALFLWLVDYLRVLQEKLIVDRDYQADTVDTLYNFVSLASDNISLGSNISALMDYVAETLAREIKADGALLLMVDEFEDRLVSRAVYGEPDPIIAVPEDIPQEASSVLTWLSRLELPLKEGYLGSLIQGGKALLVSDAPTHPSMVVDKNFPVGSVIISPFITKDRVIGMSILTRHADSEQFTDDDFDRASLLADFSSLVTNMVYTFQDVTEKTDIDISTAIAADIQKTVTPRRIRDLPNATFSFISKPARGVCGDYFDVIQARPERIYLVMCDVAGKGVPASLIMVMIRAILYLVTNTNQDAATILQWVNRGITGKVDLDHFATLQVLIYNPLTGDCDYANAGHRPPLVWRNKDGIVDAVEMQSVPIGVEKLYDFKSTQFTLENDDIVLLYTDGIVETINASGRQFGIRNLTTLLHKSHELQAKEIVARVEQELLDFAGSVRQHDDQTLLAMKIKR